MFERFTEEARQVIVTAHEEARFLNHGHIGTEHLLIGLLRSPEDLPGRAFTEFGVDADAARAKVTEMFGRGDEPSTGQLPFTPAGKKALELALRAALRHGHNWIESSHILLGLVDVGPSPGYDALIGLGVDVDSLRERVAVLLTERDRQRELGRDVGLSNSVEIREAGREIGRFTVAPDSRLQRVLMAAAGRALQQARKEFRIEDVLAALSQFPLDDETRPDTER